MNLPQKILSELVVHMKYAKYDKDKQRRETYEEIVQRNKEMHQKFYGDKVDNPMFHDAYQAVLDRKILPSMRSLQFGGLAIERNPSRIYNCAYLPVEHPDAFSETMFLLLGGTGVGYSVQERHVEKLPKVIGPKERNRRYKIADNIEGWADAVKVIIESYLFNRSTVNFDYSDIREKGSELVVTGGKAPGPGPLRVCIQKIKALLDNSIGRKLRPIECHDIQCFIADAVLAGGIRRAAMISLFSPTDNEMLQAKSGNWWEVNPQRSRANNSVVLLRGRTTKAMFDRIWKQVEASGSGEPGIYWTNNLDWGTNPCAEIALRPYQFCNLVEVNADGIFTMDEAKDRVSKAAYIATLQAGYTDFHYLRGIWKETTKEDALIGVGVTGIASNTIKKEMLHGLTECVKMVNRLTAEHLGINPAARCTTVKPSGTSSLVLGTSSGVHAWHNDYFVRRMRVNKDEEVYTYLKRTLPQFVEDSVMNPEGEAILAIPQKAPDGAVLRSESPFEMFKRVIAWNTEWVHGGHRRGDNYNNVSATFSLKPDEWEKFGELMWKHKTAYNGISVLPYDGGTYVQAPLEDCTKEEYKELEPLLRNINLHRVHEDADYTDLTGEAACAGGACEIPY